MSKRPKKRFFTAQHILDEIEKYKQKRIKYLERAIELDCEADAMRKRGPRYLEDLNYKRLQAKKLRQQAMTILEVKIPKLGQKLAEFQTPMLPALDDGNKSIQA